jgi:site-specific DNA-methyltransferase (adenine-specific)
MLRSARVDWRTPPEVVAVVRQAFGGRIDLDPCAPPDPAHTIAKGNLAGPAGSPADGLAAEWHGSVYVNPPFGDLAAWAAKCAAEARGGAEVILLLPARTDTAYWHDHVATASLVCFWRGRLRFVGAPASCPFPVAFAYWGPRPALFHAAFSKFGMVIASGASSHGEGR